MDKSLKRIEPGVDGSGVEGGDSDEDDSPYMALVTRSLCNIISGAVRLSCRNNQNVSL